MVTVCCSSVGAAMDSGSCDVWDRGVNAGDVQTWNSGRSFTSWHSTHSPAHSPTLPFATLQAFALVALLGGLQFAAMTDLAWFPLPLWYSHPHMYPVIPVPAVFAPDPHTQTLSLIVLLGGLPLAAVIDLASFLLPLLHSHPHKHPHLHQSLTPTPLRFPLLPPP